MTNGQGAVVQKIGHVVTRLVKAHLGQVLYVAVLQTGLHEHLWQQHCGNWLISSLSVCALPTHVIMREDLTMFLPLSHFYSALLECHKTAFLLLNWVKIFSLE